MALTQEMQRALANRARAANRRLERASEGQRAYLEKQIAKYHVRERGANIVFKQGKAASEAEYRARMRELEKFMSARSSTIKGWREIKAANVSAAGETLREKQNYNITDDELAIILEEIDEGHKSKEFYSALANVEISKANADRAYREALADEIEKLVDEGLTLEKATEKAEEKIKPQSYWGASADEIRNAINERRSAQQRAEMLLKMRQNNGG